MKIKFYGRAFVSLIIISLFILPTFTHAQKQKIRVVVEHATIRLKPNIESEVIGTPPVGSVFDAEKKIGEWYEIRFASSVGAMITGYIHEMLVDLESEVTEPERRVVSPPRREAVQPPPPPIRRQPPKIMFNLGVGGLVHMTPGYDWEYSFEYYEEQARYTDSVANSTSFGFDLGFGIFAFPNIEITGGLNYFSKSRRATYGMDWPSEYFFNDFAYGETEADNKFSVMILNFGLNFHPVLEGNFRPYIGGGISYISAKIDMMENFWYIDYYDDFLNHISVEITDIEFVQESLSKLGFNIRAGANLEIAKNIFVFGEGRYIIAKTTIPHPLIVAAEELYQLGLSADEIEINLGGASIILGMKIGL